MLDCPDNFSDTLVAYHSGREQSVWVIYMLANLSDVYWGWLP